jgi:hypothetical protein
MVVSFLPGCRVPAHGFRAVAAPQVAHLRDAGVDDGDAHALGGQAAGGRAVSAGVAVEPAVMVPGRSRHSSVARGVRRIVVLVVQGLGKARRHALAIASGYPCTMARNEWLRVRPSAQSCGSGS